MFDLKIKRSRNLSFVVDRSVVATYTLDQSYVSTYDLVGKPLENHKLLMGGYVVALDPSTQKVVPHYPSYGFTPVGINLEDVALGKSDQDYRDHEIEVLWRGVVLEDLLWDNGDFSNILEATKTALLGRIEFVKETRQTRW